MGSLPVGFWAVLGAGSVVPWSLPPDLLSCHELQSSIFHASWNFQMWEVHRGLAAFF